MNKKVGITFPKLTIVDKPLLAKLAPAKAAPTNPPINVCDELEGIPNHQVIRFQTIAASKPASTINNTRIFFT